MSPRSKTALTQKSPFSVATPSTEQQTVLGGPSGLRGRRGMDAPEYLTKYGNTMTGPGGFLEKTSSGQGDLMAKPAVQFSSSEAKTHSPK